MDTILLCYIDDILVTGASEEDHLCNLAEVLKRLEKHGNFMAKSVEYLGHQAERSQTKWKLS